ncbi:frataxin, mitochondrial [Sitodiplosis mosellana]|uniref:frataxin, mitochondrial n=1 Tax=Sitodiplosis mosellana TaxID=263140 RepID=UPI002444DD68|nr:frataxin, mitochondrial [Sitodiplosis mosellana]
MNQLARNVIFSVKISQKTRTIASLVPRKTLTNHETIRLFKNLPAQTTFSAKSSLIATQTVRFSSDATEITQLDYEHFCVETLDGVCDYIEELIDSINHLTTADVVNKDGVLTVSLGSTYGTYVINKQSPNKQIWLSSPTSGPKRFDFVYAKDGSKLGYWIYKHTGETLHELLDKEFTEITKTQTEFQSLPFGSRC